MNPNHVKPNLTQKKVYHSVIEKLEKSQKLKAQLIPYLQEKYPHLLQKKGRNERIKECGNSLTFRRYYENGDIKLLSGNFCKYDRICIACATKRAMRMIKKFAHGIKVNNLYKKNWYYIVLTIKHNKTHTLEESLDKLTKAKDQLARKYRNSKRTAQNKKSFVSVFDGFAISIEVSHKGENGRHPHINIIGCTDEIIPIHNTHYRGFSNNDIAEEWKEITGDSFIHNVRKITINEKSPFSRSGLGEVFKYAIKFSDLSLEQLAEIMNLQNRKQYRFFATYGIFRGWKIEDKQEEYNGEWNDGVFLWQEEEKVYKKLYINLH